MLSRQNTKRYPQIEFYFLISGHTKFGPDGSFGTIKSNIKKSNLYSIRGLKGPTGLIQTSASSNIEVLYKDPQTGEKYKRLACDQDPS